MREGGGKQNLLRKTALHLETVRRLLRYGAFAVEKYARQVSHAAWCACAHVRSCVESCCVPDACAVRCSRKRVLVLTRVHYANTPLNFAVSPRGPMCDI